MWPYWALFIVTAWLAGTRLQPILTQTDKWSNRWWLMFVLLVLMIGLRHEVGADWLNYTEHLLTAQSQSLPDALATGDPAYSLLNWIAAQMTWGVYFVNLVCATFFAWGLVVFCRKQPLPWLAMVIAVPYLVIVVAMGYTRQATAIGLTMLGLTALAEKKAMNFVGFLLFAALFHKSAVTLIPLAVLASSRRRFWNTMWVTLTVLLAYQVLLQDSISDYRATYIEAEYESTGAAIRVVMNTVPAILFLWFRNRFDLKPRERAFWTWMSLGGLAFVGLLMTSKSSTAIDRAALYWIPLQLYVLSRLPIAMTLSGGRRSLWIRAVVVYSAMVLLVWLVFATHSSFWIPYQFYPWLLIWQ